jgi:hypothetical protein
MCVYVPPQVNEQPQNSIARWRVARGSMQPGRWVAAEWHRLITSVKKVIGEFVNWLSKARSSVFVMKIAGGHTSRSASLSSELCLLVAQDPYRYLASIGAGSNTWRLPWGVLTEVVHTRRFHFLHTHYLYYWIRRLNRNCCSKCYCFFNAEKRYCNNLF